MERRELASNVRIGGLNHFAREVEDLDATVAHRREAGVEIVQAPAEMPGSGGERFAFIRDLEGMLIEPVRR